MLSQASPSTTPIDDFEKTQLLPGPRWQSPEKPSRAEKLHSVLRAIFYISATVCLWVLSFSAYRATADDGSEVKASERSEKSLFMGYGEGGWGLGEDISSQIPVFEKQLWLFWNDSQFILDDPRKATEKAEEALKNAWKSIVPEGNGFVLVDDPNNPALPPPINQDPEANIPLDRFCLTVFHQLHCLRGIQEAYYALVRDPTSEPMLGHVNHCLDYLREGVMCYGDTALEGQSTYSSRDRANGNGSNHVCKNFDAVLNWANQRSSHRKARETLELQKQGKGKFGAI